MPKTIETRNAPIFKRLSKEGDSSKSTKGTIFVMGLNFMSAGPIQQQIRIVPDNHIGPLSAGLNIRKTGLYVKQNDKKFVIKRFSY